MICRRRVLESGLLVLAFLTACQASPPTQSSVTVAPASPPVPTVPVTQEASPVQVARSAEAEAYLTAALDIMEQYSINRRKIDWAALRTMAFGRTAGAQTPADTYTAIRLALVQLGDRHSLFRPPEVTATIVAGGAPGSLPSGTMVYDRIADIVVPGFEGSADQATAYAEQAQTMIARLDQSQPCGWIVDLRDNPGGNMWPMLAGIGPVLGDGVAGAFVDLDGHRSEYSYEAGAAREGQNTAIKVDKPYQLHSLMPAVAVLTSSRTASSGEAITVAFRGRPHTRSFGRPTFGLSTGNRNFRLSNGAFIILTVTVFADRTGVQYGKEIVPDQIVWANPVEVAAKWLLAQPACLQP